MINCSPESLESLLLIFITSVHVAKAAVNSVCKNFGTSKTLRSWRGWLKSLSSRRNLLFLDSIFGKVSKVDDAKKDAKDVKAEQKTSGLDS